MKKIIKLSESDLMRIVKRVITEQSSLSFYDRDYDSILEVLGKRYGLHPNYQRFEEFEESDMYHPSISDNEYVLKFRKYLMSDRNKSIEEELENAYYEAEVFILGLGDYDVDDDIKNVLYTIIQNEDDDIAEEAEHYLSEIERLESKLE